MDWQTIVTTVIGSGAVVSGIGYLIKKAIDKTIDARVEQIKERARAEIQEEMRRKSTVFDKQYDVFKTVLSLSYRARNTARYVINRLEDGYTVETVNPDRPNRINELTTYTSAIINLLYDERAIIPPGLFKMAHELKTKLGHFCSEEHILSFPKLYLDKKVPKPEAREEHMERLKETYKEIDNLYASIANEVQKNIGIIEETT